MARKSAARVKTIKVDTPEVQEERALPPIEETFENMKEGFVTILETSVILAKRVDNLSNVRRYAISFWAGTDEKHTELSYFKNLQKVSISAYETLLERAKEFSLEEFSKEDMKDYFSGIVPDCDVLEENQDLLEADIMLQCVKPFGEKMNAMHQTILDEIRQREMIG